MMRFDVGASAATWREPEWRDVDRLLYRWTRSIGGSAELARCAARLSLAESQGHTALLLYENDVAACRMSPLVGDGRAPTPFVLDTEARFYFWRGHADEVAVATMLAARCVEAASLIGSDRARLVNPLFAGTDDVRTAAQRHAVIAALSQRLLVLTGGPGTGKTSTVVRVLLALQQQAGGTLTVRLAAPTGKAAQRLQQAIARGRGELATQLDASWQDAFDALSTLDAQTLHRLLEFDPRSGRWRRDRDQPLAADVVVIDEASMLDLAQMRALLAALPNQARLILVGDADQLASIAAGAVLTDVVQALGEQAEASLVRLEHVFRATPALSAANAAIRNGDAAALASASTDGVIARATLADARDLRRLLQHWAAEIATLLDACEVRRPHAVERAATTLRSLQRRQLLCALRESAQGVVAVNGVLQSLLAHRFASTDPDWFPGRVVMITRNDVAHGLFNGDLGVALPDEHGRLMVWFEGRGDEAARAFVPGLLPAHETAYAITIHKSQGSEYDHVAVLLSASAESPILSRQLLYTAASRAKQSLSLWANDDVIAAALARPLARSGGLPSKLRDALRHTS
jgi:exodeoxyribonuclease V alpha subunit